MLKSKKELGQVFTPTNIVKIICDSCGYTANEHILKKLVMENSCGYGEFLIEIVDRYCRAYIKFHRNTVGLKAELETYIYGIEIDFFLHHRCLAELDNVSQRYMPEKVNWNVVCDDAFILRHEHGSKFDYVIGNPPYVRKLNLGKGVRASTLQRLLVTTESIPDLYIAFYDIGITMLNKNGVLALLTPKAWMVTKSGKPLRQYFERINADIDLIDFDENIFEESVQVAVTIFRCGKHVNGIAHKLYLIKSEIMQLKSSISYSNFFNLGKWFTGELSAETLAIFNQVFLDPNIEIKNTMVTMADDVFIFKDKRKNIIEIESELMLPVIKGCTHERNLMLFPYFKDRYGKWELYSELHLSEKFPCAYQYLVENKKRLLKRNLGATTPWYALGRSQGMWIITEHKYAVTTMLKDSDSLKITEVLADVGVYSGGFTIFTDIPFQIIKGWLLLPCFWQYIKVVGSQRQNGYYQITASDLLRYLSYQSMKSHGEFNFSKTS